MSQNNVNEKVAMLAQIENINKVDGFDPSPFAVEYTDLNTGEKRKRLPVMIQIAWFRMKYPDARFSIQVTPAKDCFVATARVYPSYKDPADAYLAEATASRGYLEEKPSVSPREWAQTAALGIALRNAGFGLQFAMAGEDFEPVAVDELGVTEKSDSEEKSDIPSMPIPETPEEQEEYSVEERYEPSPEDKVKQAMQADCPISKFKGKTLGEVLALDPGAIKWIATKFTGSEEIKTAAKLICDYSLQQAAV